MVSWSLMEVEGLGYGMLRVWIFPVILWEGGIGLGGLVHVLLAVHL